MSLPALELRVCALVLLLAACDAAVPRASEPSPAPQNAARPSSEAPELALPARAAWRLAAAPELQKVVLWVSQILIRHQAVPRGDVSFCRAGWQSMPAPPARSRAEALALASRVAQEARANPAAFAALAKRYSEDITTVDRGGALGGLNPSYLLEWPRVLDALAATRTGEVSQVVETEYGFHVFYRSPPPPRQLVSGSRIVIGHDQAQFLQALRDQKLPSRTRQDAWALARDVYQEAAAQPDRFGELAGRYSEHPDALVGSDFGTWSTWEPSDYPSQLQVLAGLAVGEVSPPFETLFGWEILRRTPNRERVELAMTAIDIPFDAGSDPDAGGASAAAALARASEFAGILREQPERFHELQQRGCCEYVVQWPEGRGPPELMALLSSLELGQIAPRALRLGLSYIVPKRIAPKPAQAGVTAQFELPAPTEPDLPYLFNSSQLDFLTAPLSAIADQTIQELGLPAATSERLRRLQQTFLTTEIPGSDERQAAVEALRRGTRELLGETADARYLAITKRRFSDALLQEPVK